MCPASQSLHRPTDNVPSGARIACSEGPRGDGLEALFPGLLDGVLIGASRQYERSGG
jgi:hypothetical protein